MSSGSTANQRGFSYVLLLVTLAIVGMCAAWAAQLGASWQRIQSEEDLLRVGYAYRRAIEAYRAAGKGEGPKSLEDLLQDPRVLFKRRFLRQLYVDPITGRNDWVLVKAEDGSILGIHSRSNREPLMKLMSASAGGLSPATSYGAWVFGAPAIWFSQNQAVAPPAPGGRWW